MTHETQNKIMLWLVVIVLVAITALGFYLGYRVSQYKIEIGRSDQAYADLAGELRTATNALGKAGETVGALEGSVESIGAERDALVEQFGKLRDAVICIDLNSERGGSLAVEGLELIGKVLEILADLENSGIW